MVNESTWRFWVKIEIPKNKNDSCWTWVACKGHGYGCFNYNGKRFRAHRFMYKIFYGGIPNGANVLHKCDNKSCVNPKHLFLGSQKDNIQDGINKGRLPQCTPGPRITHCHNGHELTKENSIIPFFRPNGLNSRKCRKCQNELNRQYRLRKKADER